MVRICVAIVFEIQVLEKCSRFLQKVCEWGKVSEIT